MYHYVSVYVYISNYMRVCVCVRDMYTYSTYIYFCLNNYCKQLCSKGRDS